MRCGSPGRSTGKDKFSVYHDHQDKFPRPLGRFGQRSRRKPPPIQVTPTSFVNVTKWTRTHTNRLLLEAGFGHLRPGIHRALSTRSHRLRRKRTGIWDPIRRATVSTTCSTNQQPHRRTPGRNLPITSPSCALSWQPRPYVTGSHSYRSGATLTNGDWRQVEPWRRDLPPIMYNAGTPVSVTLRLPMDASNGIKQDLGLFVQDRWVNGPHSLEPRTSLRPFHRRITGELDSAQSLHPPPPITE